MANDTDTIDNITRPDNPAQCRPVKRQLLLLGMTAIVAITVGLGSAFYLYEAVFRPGALQGPELGFRKSRVSLATRASTVSISAGHAGESTHAHTENSHGQ